MIPIRPTFALLVILTAGCDQALAPTAGTVDGGPSALLSFAEGRAAYSGVARVLAGSTCSGVLLKPELSTEGPAYVLTNGHCARAFGSDEVLLDEPGSGTVTFNYFHDAPERPSFGVRSLRFSTMKGTDLAILELDATYGDLLQKRIQGIGLERGRPGIEEPVVVVGAPLQADSSTAFLRVASCRLEAEVPLLLERHWHWFDFWRNQCRDISSGSSGSPLISRRTGRLLGLVNTTTFGSEGGTDCWSGRPCEVDGAQGVSLEGTSYAVPLSGLASCFDAGGVLDGGLPRCGLDDGRQLALNPAWLAAVNPVRAASRLGGARWNVAVGGRAFPYFRYKLGPAGSIDCRNTRGYGAARRVAAGSRIDDALPEAEGRYALCVLGENAIMPDGRGQDPAHASTVTLEIDQTPPRVAPRFDIRDSPTSWMVFSVFAPPEISAYTFKFGSPADTVCADERGYRPFVASPFNIPKTGGAVRFCAIGFDLADNPSPPLDELLR